MIVIAKADGEVTPDEKVFLDTHANEYGVQLDLEAPVSLESACAAISSYKGKIVTIQELVKLALVDGDYHQEERQGAITISRTLQLPDEKFQEVESWVLDGHSWVNRGLDLLCE